MVQQIQSTILSLDLKLKFYENRKTLNEHTLDFR